MSASLTIKHFGPIKEIHVELKKFNVFIGPQGAGKSSISKVLALVHSYASERRENVQSKNGHLGSEVNTYFANYGVENYVNNQTYIFFDGPEFSFEYTRSKMQFLVKTDFTDITKNTTAYYFPAERISLPMIGNSIFGLQFYDVALPKFFLQFGKDFENVKLRQKLFNVPALGVEYKFENGKDIVILRNGKELKLNETSSAIQANLPLLLILQYMERHSIAVIEEPELNSYPDLQKIIIEYIVKQFKMFSHRSQYLVLTTHSPYVLSTLNNLIQANNAEKRNPEKSAEINRLITSSKWIDFNDINVYFIEKGGAKDIMNKKNRIIGTHKIDNVSEKLGRVYSKLVEYKYP